MPRDSNGTYSLPSGNPVVTETIIESAWANTTMGDIASALTESLDRAGSGGMTGQLKLANGTVGAPGLSWGTEPTSGLYRNAAGDHRYSISSNDVLQVVAGAVRAVDGVIGTPSWSFISDNDLGWYRAGANDMRAAAAAADILQLVAGGFRTVAGTNAAPSGSFLTDTDTGSYLAGANDYGIAAGAAAIAAFSTTRVLSTVQHQFAAGSAGTPSLSFSGDTNTGIYAFGADDVGFSAAGALSAAISGARAFFAGQVQAPDGSVGAPGLSFSGDANTGIYRIGADDIGFSTAGTLRAEITSAGVFNYAAREIASRPIFNTQTGTTYTFVQADDQKIVNGTNSSAKTFTLPVLAAGTVIAVENHSATNITISRSGTSLFWSGTGGDGNRTIATQGMAVMTTPDGTNWHIGGGGIS